MFFLCSRRAVTNFTSINYVRFKIILKANVCSTRNLIFRKLNKWNYRYFYNYVSTSIKFPIKYEYSLLDSKIEQYLTYLSKEFKEAALELNKIDENVFRSKTPSQVIKQLQHLMNLKEKREELLQQVTELDLFIMELKTQNHNELIITAEEEKQKYINHINECEITILKALIPEKCDDEKNAIIELSAGVGGQEAMLFTRSLLDMYFKFSVYKGWNWAIVKLDATDLGGIRNAQISISGLNVYGIMKFESGVHRVQRVPKTEKAGRIHTSTTTVAVLPQPTDIDIVLNPKEIDMQFKKSGGAGGQHVNTTDSCVRLVHIPTGIMVECQTERCQHRNRELAFQSLRAKLYKKKMDEIQCEMSMSKKLQVGTAARSDKIRTYNFAQDRITDHRLQKSIHNLDLFLQGEEHFHELLLLLENWNNLKEIHELIESKIISNTPHKK